MVAILCIRMYQSDRRLVCYGSCSRGVRTTQAVIAGCTGATSLIKAYYLVPLSRYAKSWPFIRIKVYLDDFLSRWRGRQAEEVEDLIVCTTGLCALLSEELLCPLGTGAKAPFIVCANSVVIDAGLASATLAGFNWHKEGVWLGCDFAAGAAVRQFVKLRGRFGRIRLRKARLKNVGRHVANGMLLRSAINPAVLYSAPVFGLSHQSLKDLRIFLATSLGGWRVGCSTTLMLHFADAVRLDAIWDATLGPLMRWANLIFFKTWPAHHLYLTWTCQKNRLLQCAFPWSKVIGPAGACILTLQRIGWKGNLADEWIDDLGVIHDLRVTHPRLLQTSVEASILRWIWRQPSFDAALKSLHDGVLEEPLHSLIRRPPEKGGLDASHSGALRSVLCGGVWTRSRKWEAGLVADPWCPHCLSLGSQVTASLAHYAWVCQEPALCSLREAPDFQQLLAAYAENPDLDCWSSGLLPRPKIPEMPPLGSDSDSVTVGAEGVSPLCFTDGSGMDPKTPSIRRCGWSYAFVTEEGRLLSGAYGPLPGDSQTTPRAELYALYKALLDFRARAPLEFQAPLFFKSVIDCRSVVTSHSKGPGNKELRKSPHSDLWHSIFDSTSGFDVFTEWCKAHTTEDDVRSGLISAEYRAANALVDDMAKDGARLHSAPPVVSKFVTSQSAMVRAVGRHLAATVVTSSKLFSAADIRVPKADRVSEPRLALVPRVIRRATLPSAREGSTIVTRHTPVFFDRVMHCSVCLSSARSHFSIRNFAFSECRGSVITRLGSVISRSMAPDVALIATGHSICVSGPILWCTRCVCWARKNLRKLALPCDGPYDPDTERWKSTYRDRLVAGRDPISDRTLPVLERLVPA